MTSHALLFGSIGVVAETSELQRQAYNEAFKRHDLDWVWTEDVYREILQIHGGQNRLRTLSAATRAGLSSDLIDSIHRQKTQIAGDMIRKDGVQLLRPGVVQLIEMARLCDARIGFVTTTSQRNVDAILDAVDIQPHMFDVIVTEANVSKGKPWPDAYQYALEQCGLEPDQAIAIEDTPTSLQSAIAAGIETIAFPGAYAATQVFPGATTVVKDLMTPFGWVRDRLTGRILA